LGGKLPKKMAQQQKQSAQAADAAYTVQRRKGVMRELAS